MSQLTMARPYAKAVFELARDEKALPLWSEMLAIAADIAVDPAVVDVIKDPRCDKAQLTQLFLGVGQHVFSPVMQQFIQVLVTFKRLNILPEIYLLYEELRAKAEQRVNVEITSAQPLEMLFQNQFIEALKKRLHCDVTLECVTDKTILGGAIIRANDMVIDGSIRGRLAKLGESIGLF